MPENEKSYDEFLDDHDGFLYFKIDWCGKEDESEPIDVSCIGYSNFHCARYVALRDYLIDELHKHGGYSEGRQFYLSGCTNIDRVVKENERLRDSFTALEKDCWNRCEQTTSMKIRLLLGIQAE